MKLRDKVEERLLKTGNAKEVKELMDLHNNDILRHKLSGEFLRLVTLRKSNVNTFVVTDKMGNPIIEKRSWSTRPDQQLRIVKGFHNLENANK